MSATAEVRALAAALLLAGGCGTLDAGPTPEAPGAAVVPSARLELVGRPASGPAQGLRADVLVEPLDGQPFTVRCVRGPDGRPEPALIELTVRWQDFPGDRPESWGRASLTTVRWEASGEAGPRAPLVIGVDVALPPPGEILARRLAVEGRLIGVEFVRGELRTGGTIVPIAGAAIATCAPGEAQALEGALRSGAARGIFTAAAAASPADRPSVTGRLVEALDGAAGPARDAICAALHYLTGELYGRDAARWRNWWDDARPRP